MKGLRIERKVDLLYMFKKNQSTLEYFVSEPNELPKQSLLFKIAEGVLITLVAMVLSLLCSIPIFLRLFGVW